MKRNKALLIKLSKHLKHLSDSHFRFFSLDLTRFMPCIFLFFFWSKIWSVIMKVTMAWFNRFALGTIFSCQLNSYAFTMPSVIVIIELKQTFNCLDINAKMAWPEYVFLSHWSCGDTFSFLSECSWYITRPMRRIGYDLSFIASLSIWLFGKPE